MSASAARKTASQSWLVSWNFAQDAAARPSEFIGACKRDDLHKRAAETMHDLLVAHASHLTGGMRDSKASVACIRLALFLQAYAGVPGDLLFMRAVDEAGTAKQLGYLGLAYSEDARCVTDLIDRIATDLDGTAGEEAQYCALQFLVCARLPDCAWARLELPTLAETARGFILLLPARLHQARACGSLQRFLAVLATCVFASPRAVAILQVLVDQFAHIGAEARKKLAHTSGSSDEPQLLDFACSTRCLYTRYKALVLLRQLVASNTLIVTAATLEGLHKFVEEAKSSEPLSISCALEAAAVIQEAGITSELVVHCVERLLKESEEAIRFAALEFVSVYKIGMAEAVECILATDSWEHACILAALTTHSNCAEIYRRVQESIRSFACDRAACTSAAGTAVSLAHSPGVVLKLPPCLSASDELIVSAFEEILIAILRVASSELACRLLFTHPWVYPAARTAGAVDTHRIKPLYRVLRARTEIQYFPLIYDLHSICAADESASKRLIAQHYPIIKDKGNDTIVRALIQFANDSGIQCETLEELALKIHCITQLENIE